MSGGRAGEGSAVSGIWWRLPPGRRQGAALRLQNLKIKLTKRRRDGCLAAVFRSLVHLRIDLVHVSSGKIGNCYI